MSAEQYSFQGAAWYSAADKYEKRKFDDFVDDGPLEKQVTGGWIGMLQHHFFSAWIPGTNDASTFSLATPSGAGGTQYLIRELGPGVNVAPGAKASTEARLWVGPKLVKAIDAQNVPGLDRAVDFSSYSLMATLAGWLFWVLEKIYRLVGNWGWAIVGLVVLIKLAMFPLSAAQYKSMAKMRKFQPRMAQLKERYGDDKQKLQMAMMELYKKEKINPVGGCLPILLQMPVFLALYWMLLESVELRQAPWIGWITDLTARDPYFVLPVINVAVMWFTQKLNPTAGMDPMQAEDDAVHAAGVRRDVRLLPGRPGAVLGDQRRVGPAAAVVDDQALQRGAGEGLSCAAMIQPPKPAAWRASSFQGRHKRCSARRSCRSANIPAFCDHSRMTLPTRDTIAAIATAPGRGRRRHRAPVGSPLARHRPSTVRSRVEAASRPPCAIPRRARRDHR